MRHRRFFRGGLIAIFALIGSTALLATACSDDNSTSTPTEQATSTAAPSAVSTAPATPDAVQPVVTLGQLEISNAVARATTSNVAGVYFTVSNTGAADTLMAAKVDPAVAAMAQVHEVVTEGSTSKMQEMKNGLPIPANGTVELKPGGFHVMLMNLKAPLNDGDSIAVELVFANAGTVSITANVQLLGDAGQSGTGSMMPGASSTMDHS